MPRNHVVCLLTLLTGLGTFGLLTADTGPGSNQVLVVHDEIPHQPGIERTYPAIELHESEVYLNHKYTDGREKTVLAGLRFFDDRNGQMFMQDRAVWTKPAGKGEVVYLMAGHSATDFENSNYAQMIINAINWTP